MSQIRLVADSSCDLLSLVGLILSAFRSPFALRRRNFAMTPGSTSTRWSRRSARPRGAPTALARMLPTGKKPSARVGMFSPLRSRAASPAATAPRAWQSRAARSATPPAASASWIRSRRGRRRCCCWKRQPPRSATAHRLTRCAALWRSCGGAHTCSFPWSRCTISRKTARQQARGDGGGRAWHPRRWTGECGGNARDARQVPRREENAGIFIAGDGAARLQGRQRAHRALRERRVFAGAVYGAPPPLSQCRCAAVSAPGACAATMPSAAAS